ncbi:hypothetical protein [Roseateles chitosanitabidus]|uniref:hypothetical protein n=1 Tax=Roseateles chitosanitabidus TaxID=65048 RepID=UPI00082C4B7E|nr:hypothetical protein [Roseateles chitosanitabidus]
MTRDTADSSVRAFYEQHAGEMQRQELRILKAMAPRQLYTRRELEQLTGMRTGPLCGRVNALIKAGYLEVPGNKVCTESGRLVEALRLVAQQLELI